MVDPDGPKIRDIAGRRPQSGHGVMRRRDPRAGKVHHLLKPRSVGAGEPPEHSFPEPPPAR
jgi:hypothetical protein